MSGTNSSGSGGNNKLYGRIRSDSANRPPPDLGSEQNASGSLPTGSNEVVTPINNRKKAIDNVRLALTMMANAG